MRDFKTLQVWQKAHALTLQIYKLTQNFPKEECYGLSLQLRRACVSIGSNIAEGCCCGSSSNFKRFIQIAMGSASESQYQILLAHDLSYLNSVDFEKLNTNIEEVKKMLTGFIKSLSSDTDN